MSAPAELLILVSALGQADTSYLPPLNDNPPNFHILPAAPHCRRTKNGQEGKIFGSAQPNNASCQGWAGEGGGVQQSRKP